MASISFSVKDVEANTRIVNAFDSLGRESEDETDSHLVRRKILEYVKDTVKRFEADKAEKEINVDDIVS